MSLSKENLNLLVEETLKFDNIDEAFNDYVYDFSIEDIINCLSDDMKRKIVLQSPSYKERNGMYYFNGDFDSLDKDEIDEVINELKNQKLKDYKYILRCDLVSEIPGDSYKNQYLLVEDLFNRSEFDIDLKGNCCFNWSYNAEFPELMREVNSLEEVKEFCKTYDIDISNNLTKDGCLIIGANRDQIIANDLNRYDREIEKNDEESEEEDYEI